MKKSDKTAKPTHRRADPNVMGLRADVVEQNITETLETNYMPYAMSVIVSRAIPEIDGFKPSHRKLLYTMYEMGLLTKPRTKSANIVGQTMKLNRPAAKPMASGWNLRARCCDIGTKTTAAPRAVAAKERPVPKSTAAMGPDCIRSVRNEKLVMLQKTGER